MNSREAKKKLYTLILVCLENINRSIINIIIGIVIVDDVKCLQHGPYQVDFFLLRCIAFQILKFMEKKSTQILCRFNTNENPHRHHQHCCQGRFCYYLSNPNLTSCDVTQLYRYRYIFGTFFYTL